jgi:protein phosphatase
MSILAEYIKSKFKGILVFGDIHGDYKSLMTAYEYAEQNNYFFLSLGDLVDRGPNPFEVVECMSTLINAGRAGFTVGNHDDKFYRYYKGASVTMSNDAIQTLIDVGDNRKESFLSMYAEIIENTNYSNIFHEFDDIVLVHAASHDSIWDKTKKFNKSAKHSALYGEVNDEIYETGFPIRMYNWVDNIPSNKTVIVGHDRAPIHNVAITEPLIKINNAGGKAVFIDTGCGKGGFLSGAVIDIEDNVFKFKNFVDFK